MPVSGTPKEIVGEEMHRFKHHQLHSGPDKYGHFAKSREQAIAIALNVARKHGREGRAAGGASPPWFVRQEAKGMLHTGPIRSTIPGRTDHIPMKVPNGSYVLPAQHVSHIGQNNTEAGFGRIQGMMALHGHGIPSPAGVHAGGGRSSSLLGSVVGSAVFKGGSAWGPEDGVPIMAAGGEFVLPPDFVRWVGGGNLSHGHKILDEWVKRTKEDHIKTLKKLPGPAK